MVGDPLDVEMVRYVGGMQGVDKLGGSVVVEEAGEKVACIVIKVFDFDSKI